MTVRKDFYCKILSILVLYFIHITVAQCEQYTRVGIIPFGVSGIEQEFLWLSEALTVGMYGDLSQNINLTVVDREEMNLILQYIRQNTSLQPGDNFITQVGTAVGAETIIGGALSVKKTGDVRVFIQVYKFVSSGEKTKIRCKTIPISGHIESLINLRTNLRTTILQELGLTQNELIPIGISEDAYRDYAKACYFFSLSEYDKSLSFCYSAAEKSNRYVEAKIKLADLYFIKGDYERTISICRDILKIIDNDLYIEADTNIIIGDCLRQQGKMVEAETAYQKALSVYEELGHQVKIAVALHGIAAAQAAQGQKDSAILYYKKSIDIFRKFTDRSAIIAVAMGIAGVYRDMKNYKSAHKFLLESFESAQIIGDRESQFSIYYNTGLLHLEAEAWESAITEFSKAIQIAQEIRSSEKMWFARIEIAKAYISQGKHEKAISLYENSLSQEIGSIYPKEVLDACIQIGNMLLEKGYWVETRDFLEKTVERAGNGDPTEPLGIIYFEIGLTKCNLRDSSSAMVSFEKSRSIFHNLNSPRESLALEQIAILLKEKGNINRAIKTLENAVNLDHALKSPYEKVHIQQLEIFKRSCLEQK